MAAGKIRSYNYLRAKVFGKKPTFVNKLIAMRSSPHVHTEYQFSERFDNVSFSATKQDKCKCARFKDIQYSHEAERWDTVIVPMTDEEEDMAYLRAQVLGGMPYDLMGQICHVTSLNIWKPSKKKTWCTKAVGEIVYSGRPDFKEFLSKLVRIEEITPELMDMMARYYFETQMNRPAMVRRLD